MLKDLTRSKIVPVFFVFIGFLFSSGVIAASIHTLTMNDVGGVSIYAEATHKSSDLACALANQKAKTEAMNRCGSNGNASGVESSYLQWQHASYESSQWICRLQLIATCSHAPTPVTNNDPFNNQSCSGENVDDRNAASYFASGSSKAYLGRYTLVHQYRNCNKLTKCSNWYLGLDGKNFVGQSQKAESYDSYVFKTYKMSSTGTVYLTTDKEKFGLSVEGDLSEAGAKFIFTTNYINDPSHDDSYHGAGCSLSNGNFCRPKILNSSGQLFLVTADDYALKKNCMRQTFKATSSVDDNGNFQEFRSGYLIRY
ncbi:MAG: hypothetical protein QE271_07630 [Bacteriovoracaceae bacterium]|nr:hypothetical protein [Bacteriovoracaceae bacterium]